MSQSTETNAGVRRANAALVMMWVSIGALAINVLGASVFWFALPEKIRGLTNSVAELKLKVDAQEAKFALQEARAGAQEAVLARVDERTKAMQDDLRQLHQDFSFRATARPTP